jgi:hypothetical protein
MTFDYDALLSQTAQQIAGHDFTPIPAVLAPEDPMVTLAEAAPLIPAAEALLALGDRYLR